MARFGPGAADFNDDGLPWVPTTLPGPPPLSVFVQTQAPYRQLAVTFLCVPGIPDEMRIELVGALTVCLFMDRVLGMQSEGGER